MTEFSSGLVNLCFESSDFLTKSLLLILQSFYQRIRLQLLLNFSLDSLVFQSELFGVFTQLIDSLLIILNLLNSLFLLDVKLVLFGLYLIHDWEVLNGPIYDRDFLLFLRDLILETLVGLSLGNKGIVILEFFPVDDCQFVLFPSLVEVKLRVERFDLVSHEVYLLLEVFLELMEVLIGGDEVLFLLIVGLDLLHDFLEFLVGKHVLFDLVLDALEVLVFVVDGFLEDFEGVLELLFVGRLKCFFLWGEFGDLLIFVVLLLGLLSPVLGPLSFDSFGLVFLSDSLVDFGVKRLIILREFLGMLTLYCHL